MATKKKPKLGSGKRFASLKKKLMAQGKTEAQANAIAASVGRKKYGNKKMNKWSKAGAKKAKK